MSAALRGDIEERRACLQQVKSKRKARVFSAHLGEGADLRGELDALLEAREAWTLEFFHDALAVEVQWSKECLLDALGAKKAWAVIAIEIWYRRPTEAVSLEILKQDPVAARRVAEQAREHFITDCARWPKARESFPGYLIRIVRHLAYKQRKRLMKLEQRPPDGPAPPTNSPLDTLLDKELLCLLHECIAQLKPEESQIIRDYYWKGKKLRELLPRKSPAPATSPGPRGEYTSPQYASKQLSGIRDKLRKCLGERLNRTPGQTRSTNGPLDTPLERELLCLLHECIIQLKPDESQIIRDKLRRGLDERLNRIPGETRSANGPLDTLLEQELLGLLHECIAQLKPEESQIIRDKLRRYLDERLNRTSGETQ